MACVAANTFSFSGDEALRQANEFICEYEKRTLSRFIKVKTRKLGKPDRSKLTGRIFWEEGSGKGLPIGYDGTPFLILGQQVQECCHGPDRHVSQKAKEKQKKEHEHDYTIRRRKLLQPSKKMGCPASIYLRSVVCFPTYQIQRNSQWTKRAQGKQLRADLEDNGKEVFWEHRIYVALPAVDEHANHLVDEIGCLTHDVHKDVIGKIHSLVSDGVRNVAEMNRHITAFSKATFPGAPDTSNRFFPSRKDLRNHMYSALSLSQFSTEDQENLQQHVRKWETEKPEDNIYYVPSPREDKEDTDVEDFIFVYQTAWQRRLLSRYGNEICLLDATYKVCKCELALYFLCVCTNVGYIIVGCFLLPSETVKNITRGLRQLKDWNPEWMPSFFMTDYDIKEITAIETTFPGCYTYLCDFHREQSWDRWLKSTKNGETQHKTQLLKMMRAIANAVDDESYQNAVACLQRSSYWLNNERLRVWFERHWLSASKRWVRYHRQALFNVKVTTTNGLERQHHQLKHGYLNQYTDGTLTSLVATVVNQFFPDSIKRYRDNNVKCLDSSRPYSTDVPLFLRNRPRPFQEHCVSRLESAYSIPESNIAALPDNKFEVGSEDLSTKYFLDLDSSLPTCSCPDWRKTHLPCKHMLSVLLKIPDHGWHTLSTDFTHAPHLCIDETVISATTHIADSSATVISATIDIVDRSETVISATTHIVDSSETVISATTHIVDSSETVISATTHIVDSSVAMPDVVPAAAVRSDSTVPTNKSDPQIPRSCPVNIVSRCRALTSSILNMLHLVQDSADYTSIYEDLTALHTRIKSGIPKEAGILQRPRKRGRKRALLHGQLLQRKKRRKTRKHVRHTSNQVVPLASTLPSMLRVVDGPQLETGEVSKTPAIGPFAPPVPLDARMETGEVSETPAIGPLAPPVPLDARMETGEVSETPAIGPLAPPVPLDARMETVTLPPPPADMRPKPVDAANVQQPAMGRLKNGCCREDVEEG